MNFTQLHQPQRELSSTASSTAYYDYPFTIAIAYFFIAAHFGRQVFIALKLPGAVGILLVGFVSSYFFQQDIAAARNDAQLLAFFLVLLRAGCDIDLQVLGQPYFLMLVLIPCIMELVAITLYTKWALGWLLEEGLVLGCVLFCLGEGLLVPKMCEFSREFPDHPQPKVMIAWIPVEVTFALTLFGVLSSIVDPAAGGDSGSQSPGLIAAATVVKLAATVLGGIVLGATAGFLAKWRHRILLPTSFPDLSPHLKGLRDAVFFSAPVEPPTPKKETAQNLAYLARARTARVLDRLEELAQPAQDRQFSGIMGHGLQPPGPPDRQQGLVYSKQPTPIDLGSLVPEKVVVHKRDMHMLKKALTQEEAFNETILRPLFSNCHAESLLLLVGTGLVAMGAGEHGGVPLGFIPGQELFIPELFVMVTGCAFAQTSGSLVMHSVHKSLDCVWVFGSIVLFGMIGSKMNSKTFAYFPDVLPIIAVGLVFRCMGIFLVTAATLPLRSCSCAKCYPANKAMIWADAAFYFLCVLARASVQGALGAVPLRRHFFSFDPAAVEVATFVSNAAQLYIIIFAIGGMTAIETLGPRLLHYTDQRNNDLANCEILAAAVAHVETLATLRVVAEEEADEAQAESEELQVEQVVCRFVDTPARQINLKAERPPTSLEALCGRCLCLSPLSLLARCNVAASTS